MDDTYVFVQRTAAWHPTQEAGCCTWAFRCVALCSVGVLATMSFSSGQPGTSYTLQTEGGSAFDCGW
jgi:hypothetical protein